MMLVAFGETPETKEQLAECKKCNKQYPLNNFFTTSNHNIHSVCKYCREEIRKQSEEERYKS